MSSFPPAWYGRRSRGALAVLACFLALGACRELPPAGSTDKPLSPVELQGQAIFTIHCAPCHATAPDTVIVGPSLAGIAVRGGERIRGIDAQTYIQDSILAPYDYLVEGYTETMPPDFGLRLAGEEFDAVVAYLLTLK